jgi:hypothetical protein
MSNKWRGLEKPITAEDAEQERDRLFDRPARKPSRATVEALKRAEEARREPS